MKKIIKAGALIFGEKKFLIVRPKGKPYFINPGGKYEEGESALDCIKRELKEELGVDVVSSDYYKTYEIKEAAHSGLPLSLELYKVTISGDIKPLSEIEELRWLSKEDFDKKVFNLAPSFYSFVPDLIKDKLL
jgi:8-oxo-dGTP pyrophosphatase MutT (NUDIX family)